MVVERVEITTTPTSIKALIDTARGSDSNVPAKCKRIVLKYLPSETAVVSLSDGSTVNSVIVLDNVTEGIGDSSFDDFVIDRVFLRTDTGTVNIDIIISQNRV